MFTVFGFYKFKHINNLNRNKKILNNLLLKKNIRGTIIISREGVNGSLSGKNKDLNRLIGKKYLNKKSFPYGKKINFNSMRKGEVVGEHEVKFSSGKEIITLNHEAFDRALYSEGALTAAKWLMKKKPGLYSMRDVLNFK